MWITKLCSSVHSQLIAQIVANRINTIELVTDNEILERQELYMFKQIGVPTNFMFSIMLGQTVFKMQTGSIKGEFLCKNWEILKRKVRYLNFLHNYFYWIIINKSSFNNMKVPFFYCFDALEIGQISVWSLPDNLFAINFLKFYFHINVHHLTSFACVPFVLFFLFNTILFD